MYCKKCGGKIESYASHCPFCGEAIVGNSVEATYTTSIHTQSGVHKSIGGWVLTYFISALPLVGLVMLFVWAFGEKTKNNLTFRNWAKAQLLIMVIVTVLSTIMMVSLLPIMFELLEELSTMPIQ